MGFHRSPQRTRFSIPLCACRHSELWRATGWLVCCSIATQETLEGGEWGCAEGGEGRRDSFWYEQR
eukprot:8390110-Alexandrium_andersonii.AAC.1